jgi:hypothetical protein
LTDGPWGQIKDTLSVLSPWVSPIVGIGTFLITHYKIDPELTKRNKKTKHSDSLINIFEKWRDGKTTIPQQKIHSFCLSNISIDIVKEIFPTNEKSPNMEDDYNTLISHLECKEYIEIYNNFKEIVDNQYTYNQNLKKFLNKYLKCIGEVIKKPINSNILRFYLHSIIQDINYSKGESEKYSYINKPFYILFSQMDKDSSNPFTEEEEGLIRQSMIDNYDDISHFVTNFKSDIDEINCFILTFRSSLTSVTRDRIKGIKGDCYFEKDFNALNRFKRYFCKHSESTLTTCFLLRSLFHTFPLESFLKPDAS